MHDKLQSEKCARSLRALADPERLKNVQCLQSGPKTVGRRARLRRLEIANAPQHLPVLRHAGLVRDEKDGKFVVYSLAGAVSQAAGVLELGCCRLDLAKEPRRRCNRSNNR